MLNDIIIVDFYRDFPADSKYYQMPYVRNSLPLVHKAIGLEQVQTTEQQALALISERRYLG